MRKMVALSLIAFSNVMLFAADTTFTAPTISTDAVTKVVVAVASALGGIWAFRKVIKTLNKS